MAAPSRHSRLGGRPVVPKGRRIDGFYNEPYVTCYLCNHVVFLDVNQLQFLQTLKTKRAQEKGGMVPVEMQNRLPPCEGCGKLDGFVFGAHDFSSDIEALRRLKEQRREMERAAATTIARYYRKYLIKIFRRARAGVRTAKQYLLDQAAVRINAVVRGRLARRRFVTEKHLAFIKESHPSLVKHALKQVPGEPRTFWYRRPAELELLYGNYLRLVERTGQQPPRVVVERNIRLMAARILQRQHELVTHVQKRFRGFISRRIVSFFCVETYRLFSKEVSKVLRIQRVYRGHCVRMYVVPRLLAERLGGKLLQTYQAEASRRQMQQSKTRAKEGLQAAYLRERVQAKAARYLLRVPYPYDDGAPPPTLRLLTATPSASLSRPGSTSAAGGRGEQAVFYKSAFGDDVAVLRAQMALETDRAITYDKFAAGEEDIHRRAFLAERVAERGPVGYGARDQLPTLDFERQAIRGRDSSRQFAMRQYFAAEMEALKERAVQRIIHPAEEDCIHERERQDKRKTSVAAQLRGFNVAKLAELEQRRRQNRAVRRTSQYQFPEHVGFNGTEWLFQRDDGP